MPPGEFRFSDVSRRDLNTEGEPGTGRAQVIVRVTIITPEGSNPEDFPGSLELINEATGATASSDDLVFRYNFGPPDPEVR